MGELMEIVDYLREFNVVTVCIRMFLAALLGGAIGLERGRQRRAAGLRTHVLVCVGAALTALLGFFSYEVLGCLHADPLRVSAQVISGIGFLGAGTILLKGRFQITGLTTSAGLWVAAAIGLALGIGFYEGAFIAFLISLLTVTVLQKFEHHINKHHTSFGVYIEIRTDADIRPCLDYLSANFRASDVQVTKPRSGIEGHVGIEASMHTSTSTMTINEIEYQLETLDYVVYAIESV